LGRLESKEEGTEESLAVIGSEGSKGAEGSKGKVSPPLAAMNI